MNGRPCIAMDVPDGPSEIVNVDDVRGGKTQWQGAIIYARLTETGKRFTAVYHRYILAEGIPERTGSFSARALLRRDPFKNSWDFMAVDLGDPDGRQFLTDAVVKGMESD